MEDTAGEPIQWLPCLATNWKYSNRANCLVMLCHFGHQQRYPKCMSASNQIKSFKVYVLISHSTIALVAELWGRGGT